MTKLHAGEILSPEICREVDRAIETIIRPGIPVLSPVLRGRREALLRAEREGRGF